MDHDARIPQPTLAAYGFSVTSGAILLQAMARSDGLARLRSSFSWLPLDEYLPPACRSRSRRFSEVLFDPAVGRIQELEPRPLLQSAQVNPLYGDVARRFAPLDPSVIGSPFVRDLIAYDHEELATDAGREVRSVLWRVGVHQIRVVGTPALPGDPTPEGVHRDGHSFVAVHLLGRRNVRGGTFRVHDDKHDVVFEYTKRGLLDTLFLDDRRVKHSVTPIEPLDPDAGPAERDVLLVTWDAA